MLTIPAMVRVGPWTLASLSRSFEWTNCERCDVRIKEIWTCHVDPTASEHLSTLGDKIEWRVGSKCGPTLLQVSDATWKEHTGSTVRRMALLVRIEKLQARAAAAGIDLPSKIHEGRTLLLEGTPTTGQLRHLGLVVGGWLNRVPDSK